jgi:hypothetical protein
VTAREAVEDLIGAFVVVVADAVVTLNIVAATAVEE